jgi:hypothetical protein
VKLKDSLVGNLQPQPFNGEQHCLKQFLTTFHLFYNVKGIIEWHTKDVPIERAQRLTSLGHAVALQPNDAANNAPSVPTSSTSTTPHPHPQPPAGTMRVHLIKNDEQLGGLLLLSCTWKVQEVLSIYPVSYTLLVEKLKHHYDRPTLFKLFDALDRMLNLKQGKNPLHRTRDELSVLLDELKDYGIDFETFHGGIFAKYCLLRAIADPVIYNQAMGFISLITINSLRLTSHT